MLNQDIVAKFHYLRIKHDEGVGIFVFPGNVEHNEAFWYGNLDGGKSDTGCRVHRLKHVIRERQ